MDLWEGCMKQGCEYELSGFEGFKNGFNEFSTFSGFNGFNEFSKIFSEYNRLYYLIVRGS